MDDRILFNPDNRFLASSGSNDFSLYGAPADPALLFAQAPPPSTSGEDTPATPAAEVQASAAPGQTPLVPAADPSSAPPETPDAGAATPSILPPVQFAEALPSAGAVPTPLAPFAGGLTAPVVVERSEVAQQEPQSAAAPAATGDSVAAFAPAGGGTGDAVAAAAPGADLAGEMLLTEIGGALGPAVTGPLSDLLPGASVPLDDGVTDLLGSDPAGGIATLVSLVTISEVLDVRSVTAEDPVPAGPSMIDTLTADLLGETAPADADLDEAAPGLITVPLLVPGDDDLPGGL